MEGGKAAALWAPFGALCAPPGLPTLGQNLTRRPCRTQAPTALSTWTFHYNSRFFEILSEICRLSGAFRGAQEFSEILTARGCSESEAAPSDRSQTRNQAARCRGRAAKCRCGPHCLQKTCHKFCLATEILTLWLVPVGGQECWACGGNFAGMANANVQIWWIAYPKLVETKKPRAFHRLGIFHQTFS